MKEAVVEQEVKRYRIMQEKPETLLEETSELLGELIPIVQRSIDALQQNPNPLLQHLQHLIDQEIERQEGLLQQVEEMKKRIHDYLNPPEPVPEQAEPENCLLLEILGKGGRSGNFCVACYNAEWRAD